MAKIHYADDYQPDFGIPWRSVLSRERVEDLYKNHGWTDADLARYVKLRKDCEANAISNPVGQGWSLPSWDLVQKNWKKYNIHVLLGGNQSAKTTFGSRLTVWAGATIPESEVYCWHVTDKRSIDDQQRFVWEALPEAVKKLPTKKGISHSLQYGQKNGFTDGICILPPLPSCRRGGSIKFFNYAQYAQNDQIIEGVKAHFMWADEVIPLELMETIRKGRLMTYHGRLLLTFTVIDGWNDTIQKILAKTKTLQTRFCDHPKIMKEIPVMQESLSVDSCAIYYAWTMDNPFTDYQEFLRLNAGADRETILARGFGIPTKSITSIHPGFNPDVNVIPHDKMPWLEANLKKDKRDNPVPYKVTRYMVIDPAGSKNWAMAWVAIDSSGTWWVYREWPDYDDWALPSSTPEGKPGPAQKGSKRGIRDYVELIKDLEGDEEIFERYIDPRMGAAEKQSEDGATTIISDLDDAGMTVIPAPGVDIENGTQLLNNLFAYDETKPRDSMNSPKIFISDRCQNTIYMFKEHTGKGGRNEATKDFHDLYRYLSVSDIQFIDAKPHGDPLTYGRTSSY
jgi:hypothetical protein